MSLGVISLEGFDEAGMIFEARTGTPSMCRSRSALAASSAAR
jgi:hypothetical protein